jgi:hypothetical protein
LAHNFAFCAICAAAAQVAQDRANLVRIPAGTSGAYTREPK